MSDKTPLERVLDVVVFGPTGLAITLGEEFPKLVDKGRHRVEGQVHTARLVGQFAVQFGRQKVEEWTGTAATKVSSVVTPGAPEPSPMRLAHSGHSPAAGSDLGDPVVEPAAGPTLSSHAAPAAEDSVESAAINGYKPSTHLAIPGYDSLSASQVVQRLDGLSEAELEEVRAHELASRRRRTILSRVEQLLASTPPGQA